MKTTRMASPLAAWSANQYSGERGGRPSLRRWLQAPGLFALMALAWLAASCGFLVPAPTPVTVPLTPTPTPAFIPVIPTIGLRPTPTQERFDFATPTPRPTATPAPVAAAPDGRPTIEVLRPKEGQRVSTPLLVEGTASVFEGLIETVLLEGTETRLTQGMVAASVGAPGRGTFALSLNFTPPARETPGILQVYSRNPRDGSIVNLITLSLLLGPR